MSPLRCRARVTLCCGLGLAIGGPARADAAVRPPPAIDRCMPARGPARADAMLARAMAATGLSIVGDSVLRIRSHMLRELRDLSDRAYPPFETSVAEEEIWIAPATGVERTPSPGLFVLTSSRATGARTDTAAAQASATSRRTARWLRAFDPWAVLRDWTEGPAVTVVGRCRYRDAWRAVLARQGPLGRERLFINEADGLPLKLERMELYYFTGAERAEYLYTEWGEVGGAVYPYFATRLLDGVKDRVRAVLQDGSGLALVARARAPILDLPSVAADLPDTVRAPMQVTDEVPDTVRVGRNTFLLATRAFTSAVALAADTVFILDAPQGDARARQDSIWIATLFPGRHPVVVVAQTGIWPHIGGTRFWVARGATVVTHPIARPAIARLLAARPDGPPDPPAAGRRLRHPRIDLVDTATVRAGGGVRILPIDGIASEGVLAVYLPGDRFVWASDRIQDTTGSSLSLRYLRELARTVDAAGIEPQWTSGPHHGRIPWRTIENLLAPGYHR